jgi:hypothetical protein
LLFKEHAPKTVKIYANRLNIGFDETDSIGETQSLELSETNYEENAIIPLRFVKFQNIRNIAVGFYIYFFHFFFFYSMNLIHVLLLVICAR